MMSPANTSNESTHVDIIWSIVMILVTKAEEFGLPVVTSVVGRTDDPDAKP